MVGNVPAYAVIHDPPSNRYAEGEYSIERLETGDWWKSPEEVRFHLDGEYVYSIKPKVARIVPAFVQMAGEIYDWNPIPGDGGLMETCTWQQRTTQLDWVRTWKLADEAVAPTEASPAENATLHCKPAGHVLGDALPYYHEGECPYGRRSCIRKETG